MATANTATATTTGIDAVYYMTKDFNRAKAFYEAVLGAKPASEMKGEEGTFVEYEFADGATFGLGYIAGYPWHDSGGVMFAVPDVSAAVERAKAAGATVNFGPEDTSVCTMSWLTDTEGNTFCLHKRK